MIFRKKYLKNSYSQSGEDLIIYFIFNNILNIPKPNYIDVGAYHPFILNNTAIFYLMGCRGMNIEPNPDQVKLFYKHRKLDVNVNIGVTDSTGQLSYYLLKNPTLNTFKPSSVIDNCRDIVKTISINVDYLSNIIDAYWVNQTIDLLCIDVEGLNLNVIRSLNFNKHRPKVICAETIIQVDHKNWKKDVELINHVCSKDYIVHSDTCINTVFIDKNIIDFTLL